MQQKTETNPLVASGEYKRFFAGDLEIGDALAAYDDARVVEIAGVGSERVLLTLKSQNTGMPRSVMYKRATTLLVKVEP
jgi:hypothetical protein